MPFIVFEGPDGAGLSTQSAMLKDYLMKKGRKVILTKEPTIGLVGGLIKAGLRGEWKVSNLTTQLLYVADRSHHLETEIEPALKKNMIVICDRYILSTLAFGSLDVPLQFLKQMNAGFRKPDMTFILDVHPKLSLDRICRSRSQIEVFETEQKLEHIRRAYLSLKNYFPNTYVIDANNPVEQVAKDVQKIIDRRI